MADDTKPSGFGRKFSNGLSLIKSENENSTFDREERNRMFGKLKLRGMTDDLPQ